MCGIIGIIGKAPVTPLLLEALSHAASGEFAVAVVTVTSFLRR
jgi:hypothetical protein